MPSRNDLLTKPAAQGNHTTNPGNVSPRTVREVHKILRPALSFAVKSGYIDSNPAIHVELPKEEKYERDQWTEDEVKQAIQLCEDPELRLMMQLMYTCTLRTDELLGLEWKHLHIRQKDGEAPFLEVKQELARLDRHDIKVVQGDMGHSSTDMLMNTYAAIVDEERQKLAAHMEESLFASDDSPEEHDDV